MAWSVNNIMDFFRYIINKQQTNNLTPIDLFYAWNPEQNSYQSDLIGRWQNRSNGKDGINTGLIENSVILTKLSSFTKNILLPVAAGIATKPSDFVYALALRSNNFEVYPLTKGQIQSVVNSSIDPPSVLDNRYYSTEYLNTYLILPSNTTSIELDYIATPTDVVWGYTVDGNGRLIYDQATSSQPQWLQPDIIEITKRCLNTFGVHYSSQDFEQFGQKVITTGS